MPSDNHKPVFSAQMITAFVVLGVVLVAVPLFCTIFVLISKRNQNKRAEVLKKATGTKTTLRTGPNGRTIFEATTTKPFAAPSSSPSPPPRDPILPFTQQQASKAAAAARSSSTKAAWKRLSRPFSMAYAAFDHNSIELNSMPKPHPDSRACQSKQNLTTTPEDIVSPITPQQQHWTGPTSSWNTIDALDSTPISPLSVTGGHSSSKRGSSINGGWHGRQSTKSQRAEFVGGSAAAGTYAAKEKLQLSLPLNAKVSRR